MLRNRAIFLFTEKQLKNLSVICIMEWSHYRCYPVCSHLITPIQITYSFHILIVIVMLLLKSLNETLWFFLHKCNLDCLSQ